MNDKDYPGHGIALTIENAPKFVSRLKKALRKNDITLQQNQCYELMAQMFGASNWHELHTLLKKDKEKEQEFNPVSLPKSQKNEAMSPLPLPLHPIPSQQGSVLFATSNVNANTNNNNNTNSKLKSSQPKTEMMAILEDLDNMFDPDDSIFGNFGDKSNEFSPMELFNEHIDNDKLWKTRHPQIMERLKDVICYYNATWIANTDKLTLGLANTWIEGMKKISMADKKVLFTFRHKILAILTYLPTEYTYAFMEVLAKYPGLLPALIAQNSGHRENQKDDFLVFESRIKDLIKVDGLDEALPPLHAEWIRNIYRDDTSESPFIRRSPNPPRNDNLKKDIVTLIEEISQAIRQAHFQDDEYDEF